MSFRSGLWARKLAGGGGQRALNCSERPSPISKKNMHDGHLPLRRRLPLGLKANGAALNRAVTC